MKNKNKKTGVYKMYDNNHNLLYVGMTVSLLSRMSDHIKQKEWFTEVEDISITWYSTRFEAEVAEKTSIRWDDPKYNKRSVIKNTDAFKHLQTLFGVPITQQDDFHKQLIDLRLQFAADLQSKNIPCDSGNAFEWSLMNAYNVLCFAEEWNFGCEDCIKLASSWWLEEGHGAVCSAYRRVL